MGGADIVRTLSFYADTTIASWVRRDGFEPPRRDGRDGEDLGRPTARDYLGPERNAQTHIEAAPTVAAQENHTGISKPATDTGH